MKKGLFRRMRNSPWKEMKGKIPCLSGKHFVNGGNDVVHIHAEFFQHLRSGSGEAEAVDAHGFPWQPRYFHQRSVTPASTETLLMQEEGSTLSRYSAGCASKRKKLGMETTRIPSPDVFHRFQGQFQFGTTGKNNGFQGALFLPGDVGSFQHAFPAGLNGDAVQRSHFLARSG